MKSLVVSIFLMVSALSPLLAPPQDPPIKTTGALIKLVPIRELPEADQSIEISLEAHTKLIKLFRRLTTQKTIKNRKDSFVTLLLGIISARKNTSLRITFTATQEAICLQFFFPPQGLKQRSPASAQISYFYTTPKPQEWVMNALKTFTTPDTFLRLHGKKIGGLAAAATLAVGTVVAANRCPDDTFHTGCPNRPCSHYHLYTQKFRRHCPIEVRSVGCADRACGYTHMFTRTWERECIDQYFNQFGCINRLCPFHHSKPRTWEQACQNDTTPVGCGNRACQLRHVSPRTWERTCPNDITPVGCGNRACLLRHTTPRTWARTCPSEESSTNGCANRACQWRHLYHRPWDWRCDNETETQGCANPSCLLKHHYPRAWDRAESRRSVDHTKRYRDLLGITSPYPSRGEIKRAYHAALKEWSQDKIAGDHDKGELALTKLVTHCKKNRGTFNISDADLLQAGPRKDRLFLAKIATEALPLKLGRKNISGAFEINPTDFSLLLARCSPQFRASIEAMRSAIRVDKIGATLQQEIQRAYQELSA